MGHCSTCPTELAEWYRVVPGGPLRHRDLGSWSRLGGLEINVGDTWQRRSDLEGLQLNVATVEVSVCTPRNVLLDYGDSYKQDVTQGNLFILILMFLFSIRKQKQEICNRSSVLSPLRKNKFNK